MVSFTSPKHNQLKVFVYGTLRKGGRNRKSLADRIENAETGFIRGKLYRRTDKYAFLTLQGDKKVKGELITLKNFEEDIAFLDSFEGPEYKRIKVKAEKEDKSKETVYTYVYAQAGEPADSLHIQSGDWIQYCRERNID